MIDDGINNLIENDNIKQKLKKKKKESVYKTSIERYIDKYWFLNVDKILNPVVIPKKKDFMIEEEEPIKPELTR